MKSDIDIRRRLNGRLRALGVRVTDIEETLSQPLNPDFAEQAAQREDEEALIGIESAAVAEIAQIRAALRRLDAGKYGRCVTCGETIAPDRLAVLPAAAQCVGCATAFDRHY